MFERIVGFFGAAIGAIWLRFVYSSLVNSSFVIPETRRTPGYSATEATEPFVFWATILTQSTLGIVFFTAGLILLVRGRRKRT